ncbi:cysteine hydrolase [Paenibacillus sp. FSL R7-0345]|uniref:cysteine hydrolase family protein n=1 Tax=Paenibacillus sp. FSL R7-0345 TaxID=2954535 RepID=UPI00315A0AED
MGKHAIVVIDMLNDFIHPDGALTCPNGAGIVPALQDLIAFSHENEIQVIFVQEAHRKNDADFRVRPVHAIKGSWGSDFIAELTPDESKGDYVVQKRRHSAFSYTDMDLFLREEGIDTVAVTGVWTNVCVRSTASDAMYHTYKVVCISDCCASKDEEMHQSGLRDIGIFGEVVTLEQYKEKYAVVKG